MFTSIQNNLNIYKQRNNNGYANNFCGNIKNLNMYKQVNEGFDKDKTVSIIKKRIPTLPNLMNQLVSAPIEYIEQKVDANTLTGDYISSVIPFYKRIEIGNSAEGYKKIYKPEISFIKQISKACNNYFNNKQNLYNFNSNLEKAIDKYANKDIKRTTNFIA